MSPLSPREKSRRRWLQGSVGAASLLTSTWIASLDRLYASEKTKLKTILLVSGWQDVNIGDITHTTGLLHVLERHFPQTKIILWKSNMKGQDSPAVLMNKKYFPNVEVISGRVEKSDGTFRGEALLDAVNEADIFLHGSGPSVIRQDALAAWSKATSKPYGIFGTTIQEVSATLKPVLENAAFVYTRETASLKILEESGIKGERTMFVPDATFDLNTRDDAAGDAFLRQRDLQERKFLCVVPRLRYTPYPGRLEKNPRMRQVNEQYKEIDHAKLREAIVAWVEKTGLPVLVCPEMTYQVDIMDELLIDPLPPEIKKHVQKRGYWMPDEAASVYARAHAVLSFECHSPIIAIAMGTPAFYLRQPEDTIKGRMYYDLGLDDWTFEIDESVGSDIAARLLETVEDYPRALEKVKAVNRLTDELYDTATSKIKALV